MSDSDTQTYGPPSPTVQAPDPSTIGAPAPLPASITNPPTATPVLAPPPPGHFWQSLLQGALTGLAGSRGAEHFGGGLAAGAGAELQAQQQKIENTRAQQAQDSAISHQDAQSAFITLQAHHQDILNHNLPDELHDKQINQSLATIDNLKAHGWDETQIVNNTGPDAQAAMEQQTTDRGAVGHNVIVNVGDKLHIFHPADVSDPVKLHLVNDDRAMNGLQPVEKLSDLGSFQDQTNALLAAGNRFGQTPTPQQAPLAVAQWQTRLNTYKSRQDADPTVTARIQKELDNQKANLEFYNGNTADEAGRVAQAKADVEKQQTSAQAKAAGAPVVAYDPSAPGLNGAKGANVVMNAGDAKAKGLFSYKADPAKINGLVAGVNDVQTKLNSLADAASHMDEVDPGISATMSGNGISLEYHGVGLGSASDLLNAKSREAAMPGMNDATRNYLVALIGAHEAITQLPRLQTMGQSSRVTEKQMEAAVKMLPVPGDDQSFATQKMEQLQNTVDPIRKQVPSMPGASLTPSFREDPGSEYSRVKRSGPTVQPKAAPASQVGRTRFTQ